MQQSFNSNIPYPNQSYAQTAQSPNAVSINIYSPQAYGTAQNTSMPSGNYCPIYNPNQQQGAFYYPPNYNNNFNPSAFDSSRNLADNPIGVQKTPQQDNSAANTSSNEKTEPNNNETKVVTPLTDEYIKSLENYLNDSNPKIRLIGAKELMERFKEDDNRKDNKSLIPLLNKTLRDTSAAVRFLGLTTLQLGYSVGNDETVQILKEIQTQKQDKTGEDNLLASEILLKMAAPQQQAVKG